MPTIQIVYRMSSYDSNEEEHSPSESRSANSDGSQSHTIDSDTESEPQSSHSQNAGSPNHDNATHARYVTVDDLDDGMGLSYGDVTSKHVRKPSSSQWELLSKLRTENAMLQSQYEVAQQRWCDLQEKKAIDVMAKKGKNRKAAMCNPTLLHDQFGDAKEEYASLLKLRTELRKKGQFDRQAKLLQRLRAQDKLIAKLKVRQKELLQMQRRNLKGLAEAEDLPMQLNRLQVEHSKELMLQYKLLQKNQHESAIAQGSTTRLQNELKLLQTHDLLPGELYRNVREHVRLLDHGVLLDNILQTKTAKQKSLGRQLRQMRQQRRSGAHLEEMLDEADTLESEIRAFEDDLESVNAALHTVQRESAMVHIHGVCAPVPPPRPCVPPQMGKPVPSTRPTSAHPPAQRPATDRPPQRRPQTSLSGNAIITASKRDLLRGTGGAYAARGVKPMPPSPSTLKRNNVNVVRSTFTTISPG